MKKFLIGVLVLGCFSAFAQTGPLDFEIQKNTSTDNNANCSTANFDLAKTGRSNFLTKEQIAAVVCMSIFDVYFLKYKDLEMSDLTYNMNLNVEGGSNQHSSLSKYEFSEESINLIVGENIKKHLNNRITKTSSGKRIYLDVPLNSRTLSGITIKELINYIDSNHTVNNLD